MYGAYTNTKNTHTHTAGHYNRKLFMPSALVGSIHMSYIFTYMNLITL